MNHDDLDRRPSATQRRRIRMWMFAWLGVGGLVRCWHCGHWLTNDLLQLDRIDPDGPYSKANLQPSCGPCNRKRQRKPARRAA